MISFVKVKTEISLCFASFSMDVLFLFVLHRNAFDVIIVLQY